MSVNAWNFKKNQKKSNSEKWIGCTPRQPLGDDSRAHDGHVKSSKSMQLSKFDFIVQKKVPEILGRVHF